MSDSTPLHKPYDVEVEAALLGSLLRDNALIDIAAAEIEAGLFYDGLHGRVFQALVEMSAVGTVTPVLLKSRMRTDPAWGELEGGSDYLDDLWAAAPASPNIRDYCRWVKEYAQRRELQAIAEEVGNSVYDPPAESPAQTIADRAMEALLLIGRSQRPILSPYEAAMASLRQIEQARFAKTPPGVSTGLSKLDAEIGRLRGADLCVIMAGSGMGKEQPVDTPVLTPSGWRQIGDLNIGDLVFGRAGDPIAVIGVWPQGRKQSFKVTFRDETSVECGSHHLWTVIKRHKNGTKYNVTAPLQDLVNAGILRKKSDSVRRNARWQIPVAQPVQFTEKNLQIDPYVLGVLIGDGATSGRDLRFSNPDIDSDIRVRVQSRLPIDVYLKENRSGACPYFRFCGDGARRTRGIIREMGLAVKSPIKFIPEVFMLSSVSQRRDLLRGLMDTDGSCLNNRTHFYTTSERLSRDVAQLVRSLGGIAIERRYAKGHLQKPDEFHVNVKMDACPFYTARKIKHWRPTAPVKSIVSVEPARMIDQVCITVAAPDGLYLTKDCIVTHNSTVMPAFALQAALRDHPVIFFSLEMKQQQVVNRMMCDLDFDTAQKPMWYKNFRNATISDDEFTRAGAAAQTLGDLPLEIQDADDLTIQQISSRARAFAAKHPGKLGLVLIDYLQIVAPTSRHDGTREQEVSGIARGAKALAKRLDWPVVAGAQINTGGKTLPGKERPPTLDDARESKAIIFEADIVLSPWREAYYVFRQKPRGLDATDENIASWRQDWEQCQHKMDMLGLKNREGAQFEIELYCEIGSSAIRDEAPIRSLTGGDRFL